MAYCVQLYVSQSEIHCHDVMSKALRRPLVTQEDF